MVITVNKLKHMACHWPHASQIATTEIFVTKFVLMFLMKKTWYWSRVLSNNLEKQIKIYGQSLLKTNEKESKYSVVVFLLFMFIKIIAHVKE